MGDFLSDEQVGLNISEDAQSILLRSTMNPFNAEVTDDAKLYHLSSERAASNDMKDDLINVVSNGRPTTWAEKNRQGCKENPARFKKPIKRRMLEGSESKRCFV